MALVAKVKYVAHQTERVITVEELIGEYSLSNTGGYGSPNPDKSSIALVCQVKYKASNKDYLITLNEAAVDYSAAYVNSDVSQWTFPLVNDGYYQIILFSLPTVEPVSPVDNDVYYDTVNSQVKKYVTDAWVIVTDYDDINIDSVTKVTLKDIITVQYYRELQRLWLAFIDSDSSDIVIWNKYWFLYGQLQSAESSFNNGYENEAQKIIESLDPIYDEESA